MTSGDIEAVVRGRHPDVFRILGPHETATGWQVRAFQPHARALAVLVDGRAVPMTKEHAEGFFCADLDGGRRPYKLRITYPHDVSQEIEDPYRFPPLLSDFEIYLHGEGTHFESWRAMGAHLARCEGVDGVRFTVWAPTARVVSVAGEFNGWDTRLHPMRLRNGGIWEIFLPEVKRGAVYKFAVTSKVTGELVLKSDPYGFHTEVPPKQASIVWGAPEYDWHDQDWMKRRASRNILNDPVSIYEVHLGSWMKGDGGRDLTYRELADTLVPYVKKMNFTHLEILPIMEHPYTGSWGYQVSGYYAPTARFGTPEDFMFFIDRCHQEGIGVILDWVPGHFPRDAHGLAKFDGTALYEHEDPRQGEHRDWGTLIFNYGRNEVRTFLLSNALWWLERFHLDGLRVDAVASMIYLDYSRNAAEWIPNRYGGRENLDALDFLRKFNELVHQVPGAATFAEESTSFPGVCRPVYLGGLGFTMKWNMGWMHDMLRYFAYDPIFRKFHHNEITFSLIYAFTENFVLPISHDEVVHLKRSLIGKMPGDEWRRFANVRAFLAYMWGHPGKKLLFMGQEIGQYEEWDEKASVRWDLLAWDKHRELQTMQAELNQLYRDEPALHQIDFRHEGFEWVDFSDVDSSVIAFLRFGRNRNDFLFFVCNFTPLPRENYRLGVPRAGKYVEIFNSDWARFGGSDVHNDGAVEAIAVESHGRPARIELRLPPMGVLILKPEPLAGY